MLKKLFLSAIVFSAIFSSHLSKAQMYDKGAVLVDAYYGWPNLFSAVLKTTYENTGLYEDLTVSSFGPVGGRIEYVLSKRIGLGININYANTTVKGKIVYEDFNSQNTTYDFTATVPRLRVLPTLNVHMGSSDEFDPYFAFGLGYSSFSVKATSNDPDFDETQTFVKNRIPVAARVEFGLRYFFSDHLGGHIQAGLGGGPLLAAGLSFKF